MQPMPFPARASDSVQQIFSSPPSPGWALGLRGERRTSGPFFHAYRPYAHTAYASPATDFHSDWQ